MSDWPVHSLQPPPVLTPWHPDSLGILTAGSAESLNNTTNGSWPANNLAFFYPFRLHSWALARQLLFFVGGVSAGNIDVGIYDSQNNLIVSSGSTAMSATINTLQELNITDTVLPPGTYLLAVVCSTTSAQVIRSTALDEVILPGVPVYEQATALPLPAACAPVISTQNSPPIIGCGIQFAPVF